MLSSPNRVRRGSVVGEIGVIAEPKRKPRQDNRARLKRERRHQENALDEALKDTFPAGFIYLTTRGRQATHGLPNLNCRLPYSSYQIVTANRVCQSSASC